MATDLLTIELYRPVAARVDGPISRQSTGAEPDLAHG